jgi:hypothetical protein
MLQQLNSSQNLPDWIVASCTIIGLLLSIVAFVSAVKSQRKLNRFEEQNSKSAKIQSDLSYHSWKDEYFRDLERWSVQTCDSISEAIHRIDQVGYDKTIILIKLSSLIDQGRWYFPNYYKKDYGVDKPLAYRGFRQDILDHRCEAYRIVLAEDINGAKEKLTDLQRLFVSEIQTRLNPEKREETALKISAEFAAIEKMT